MIKLTNNIVRQSIWKLISHKFVSTSSAKKIKDADEISPEEMEELLGRPLRHSQLPKQQSISKASTSTLAQQRQQKKEVQNQKQYFYGLMPMKNENYPICLDPDEYVIQETPNQNLFKALDLPNNCSFSQYTAALSKFRKEIDLYGDQQQKSIIISDSLEFKQLLHPQSQYLLRARKSFLVNISIPGTIECEDPRNFMELRPIQQFRHTPLVPISESYMQKHKQMLERYHRKQFVFQVSTQSVINWVLILGCVGMASYLIYLILQKEEQRTVNFSRMKYQRLVGESQQKPVFKI